MKTIRVGVVVVIAGLISVQQFVVLPVRTSLDHALANALHWPMFALIAVGLCVLFGRSTRVLALGLLLAVGTEAAQLFTGRQPSWSDLAIDVVGTVSGLAAWQIYAALGKDWRRVALGLALVLVGAAVSSVGPVRVWLALGHRDRLAPKLVDFSSEPGLYFVRTTSEHELVPPPPEWDSIDEPLVMKLRLADEKWPGLALTDTLRDWSGYEALRVDLFLAGDDPVPIRFRARKLDGGGLEAIMSFELRPGSNRWLVPLDRAISGDRSRVHQLVLYSERPYAGTTLYLSSLVLER